MSANPSPGVRPGSAFRGLIVYTLTLITFFGASSVPTPLYHVYQAAWGFSSGMLTLVFGVYAISLLTALLFVGALSDYLGRKPVVLGAIALEAVALLIFVDAHSLGALILARVVQGVATGIAAAALGAATQDENRALGPLVNSISPMLGMGVGALGSGMLIEYAPAPMRLGYLLALALFAFFAVAIMRLPETARRRPGVAAAMRPRIQVPAAARGMLMKVMPVNVAVWALGGFYLSLGPTLARTVTGSDTATIGGWAVLTLTFSGVAAILSLRSWPAPRLLKGGAWLLAAGLAVTLVSVQLHAAALFFGATIVVGSGFGIAFQGALRSILPLAEAHERAGLMAAIYVLSYLAFCLPAIGAGMVVPLIGFRTTTNIYGALLIVLAMLSPLLLRQSPVRVASMRHH